MTAAKPITETYLTLVGEPGSHPPEVKTILDYPGEGHFVVDRVVKLADGSWQANAVPASVWRRFERQPSATA